MADMSGTKIGTIFRATGSWFEGFVSMALVIYITKRLEFFVNKFHLDFQYLTLDCMEEWFYNRTMAYYKGEVNFDIKPYISHKKK